MDLIEALSATDALVFWIVAGARFLLPLTIPRYPLPGILASLLLDAVDQTIFQQFPGLKIEGYQGYDKAFDIYYLSIAYISTLRNWENFYAFQVSRFLFYWRLVGVAIFEMTQFRPLLLIFPNTFEYFFIFYETYRLRWSPQRLTKNATIIAAALIWIVIKLPQEYWIHISQTDTTDWIKTNIFGVTLNTPWSEIMRSWPGILIIAFFVVIPIVTTIWWLVRKRLPPEDHTLAFNSDAHQSAFTNAQVRSAIEEEARQVVDAALLEKVVLVSLVSLSFAQVLPGVRASNIQLLLGVASVVVVNTTLSHWISRRRFGWAISLGVFVLLGLVNLVLIFAYSVLRSRFDEPVSLLNALFFVILLTLLITLFDRYRQIYLMRKASSA